ncbi:VOC family protein [Croceitalea marina]|uniref:VOC family protein n=1 Tax=Croceitalea marina TaxID=1775166 RepID=A0ABW5MS67_9FLAO
MLFTFCLIATNFSCTTKSLDEVKPIHLDDIHFIVTDEEAAVTFFQKHFGAREMAHPGERFDLARFLSLKWQDPTITITSIGPYKDLPVERNQRWLNAEVISPKAEKSKPVYGAKWLALAVPSIKAALKELQEEGAVISEYKLSLPLEPDTPAFSIYGPDGFEIVIVERTEKEFGAAKYSIDHIQFLVEDVEETKTFFEKIYSAQSAIQENGTISLKVADANLILSAPKVFDINPKDVSFRKKEGTIRIGLDHLGFLYGDVNKAVDQAALQGYSPIFSPQRYIYKNKPTVYTFTAFSAPNNINIEMVQVDGRVGPHSYYMD